MKKYIGLSLIMVSIVMLLVGFIPIKTTKTITYENTIYKSSYIMDDLDIISVPEIRAFEIADEIKRPNDESNYVFLALIVGLLGFVITRVYLKHIN